MYTRMHSCIRALNVVTIGHCVNLNLVVGIEISQKREVTCVCGIKHNEVVRKIIRNYVDTVSKRTLHTTVVLRTLITFYISNKYPIQSLYIQLPGNDCRTKEH